MLGLSASPAVRAAELQAPTTADRELGATLFTTHCAACHGKDARGSGIITSALRHTPPDLTRYTARNGGVFPRERVYRIIETARYRSMNGLVIELAPTTAGRPIVLSSLV